LIRLRFSKLEPWQTLADGLAQPQDNFLLLRFLAAALVIYGHGYAIMVHKGPPELIHALHWGVYSGTMAVDVFFVVSGFLVTGSFLRRRHLPSFLWARALRVVPAYVACLVASALVLGAACTTLPLAEYLLHPQTRSYVLTNLHFGTRMIWRLPGVFADNPRRATINGSLWTLPAEVRMYLWVALVGTLGILARRRYCNILLTGLFWLGLIAPHHLPMVPVSTFVRLAGFFALGAFCYINRDWIRIHGSMVIVLAFAAWLSRHTPVFPCIFGLAEAAFVFWFAYRTRWHGWNRLGDYSYGLYLWGFPVQQVVAHNLPDIAPLANAALSLPLATVLAVVSWHLIEKPALSLKGLPATWRRRWLSVDR
jgi:peptidoglycan/LPS O-acetylase OafA/YrhL